MRNIRLLTLLFSVFIFQSCQSQNHGDLPNGMYASIQTDKGEILLKLTFQETPVTVANFVSLAEGNNPLVNAKFKDKKYFDGLKFHRVVPNFVIQGGDPDGTGSGGPGYKFEDEFARDAHGNLMLKHDGAGVLSMANAGPGTNGSQFFITHNATPHLDGRHSVFGKVVEGQEVVNAIAQGDVMQNVEIIRIGAEAKAFDAPKIFREHMAGFEARLKKAEEEKAKAQELVKGVAAEKMKFFAMQKTKAKTLPSGLKIFVTQKGNGGKPATGTKVQINYAGYFEDGRLFDTSLAEVAKQYMVYDEQRDKAMGYQPFSMVYSNEAQLVPGFKEGMLNMNYGDKALLFIPSHLGYGAQGAGNVIPPNANLIFEIEIVNPLNDSDEISLNTNSFQNNSTKLDIYKSIKRFDFTQAITPEIIILNKVELVLLKLSENVLSLINSKDWSEIKKINNDDDDKIKLSNSYFEGNDLYIALYNSKKNSVQNYIKLNLSTFESIKVKCVKTDRGCSTSSASSEFYITPKINQPVDIVANENVISYKSTHGQNYYEVSNILKENVDYNNAISGNYKEKLNFLKLYPNSIHFKNVEKMIFDNFKTINEVYSFQKENPNYYELSSNRAYTIAKNSSNKLELKDFLTHYGTSSFVNEIKIKLTSIEKKEEQQRIAIEQARIKSEKEEKDRILAEQKAKEQKILDDQKREAEYQKYLVEKEKNRINRIKAATEGDKICFVQNRVSVYDDRDYFFGIQIGGSRQEVNYSMKVICFVEKNLGEKMKIRVGAVSSSNKKEFSTPIIDGVEYQKGDILWIKPLKDSNWFVED